MDEVDACTKFSTPASRAASSRLIDPCTLTSTYSGARSTE
jgi:hypothetical protein